MSVRILVLHGPNLGRKAQEWNSRLEARASSSAELVFAQANGEEGLLDHLWAHAQKVRGVIVNAGVIAPNAHALAEGVAMSGLRAVEVYRPRQDSALVSVVEQRFPGDLEAYVSALEHLLGLSGGEDKPSTRPAKSIGRAADAPRARVTEAVRKGKTIGREKPVTGSSERTITEPGSKSKGGTITRAFVKERIVSRLKGRITPAELSQWAKEHWNSMQSGARVEAGAEAVIDGVLLALMSGSANNDGALITQMARLDT